MRWQTGRRSQNVEDRRGMRSRTLVGGGLGLVIVVVLAVLFGADPQSLLQQMVVEEQVSAPAPGVDPSQDPLADFVSVILGDTEDVWREIFAQQGNAYREPKLVLFTGQVQSACGFANAAAGPFYCPADEKVYIDLGFYHDLRDRFQAPGDFAQAYVIAHEVGHHVQNLLGISDRVQAARGRLSEEDSNQMSVRLELQADFLAGVWAHHAQRARDLLEAGDIEEGLRAASAIGDDRLQLETQGYVVPESFTHGTSEQRVAWFRRGLDTGDLRQGDTFGGMDAESR